MLEPQKKNLQTKYTILEILFSKHSLQPSLPLHSTIHNKLFTHLSIFFTMYLVVLTTRISRGNASVLPFAPLRQSRWSDLKVLREEDLFRCCLNLSQQMVLQGYCSTLGTLNSCKLERFESLTVCILIAMELSSGYFERKRVALCHGYLLEISSPPILPPAMQARCPLPL